MDVAENNHQPVGCWKLLKKNCNFVDRFQKQPGFPPSLQKKHQLLSISGPVAARVVYQQRERLKDTTRDIFFNFRPPYTAGAHYKGKIAIDGLSTTSITDTWSKGKPLRILVLSLQVIFVHLPGDNDSSRASIKTRRNKFG